MKIYIQLLLFLLFMACGDDANQPDTSSSNSNPSRDNSHLLRTADHNTIHTFCALEQTCTTPNGRSESKCRSDMITYFLQQPQACIEALRNYYLCINEHGSCETETMFGSQYFGVDQNNTVCDSASQQHFDCVMQNTILPT